MRSSPQMDAAVEISPLTVLVRSVLEWIFPEGTFETLFGQYGSKGQVRKLAISAVIWLMLQVVSGARRSVFAAFQADQAMEAPTIAASYQALYGKIGRMAPTFSCALVRESANRLSPLMRAAGCTTVPGWSRYRLRIIDGTQPDGTEHRLGVLRTIKSAGLPCQFVVEYDPATGLCVDAAASEDAYTSERVLAAELLERIDANDLIVADRGFCTLKLLTQIVDQRAHFVIREHQQLCTQRRARRRKKGRIETGLVWEEAIEVYDPETGRRIKVRRIIVELDEPTREGETEIRILTNLPRRATAERVAVLYRDRWTIERHFDFLKNDLHGQIESLGRPRAAILSLCLAMVAANAAAAVKQAIKAAHGEEEYDRLSGYYLADEIAGNYRAIDRFVKQATWNRLAETTAPKFWRWCRQLAGEIRTSAFYTHPRGPKTPPPKRASGKKHHHYSTYRLLQAAKKRC